MEVMKYTAHYYTHKGAKALQEHIYRRYSPILCTWQLLSKAIPLYYHRVGEQQKVKLY